MLFAGGIFTPILEVRYEKITVFSRAVVFTLPILHCQFIEPLEQLAGTEQVIRINAQNEPFMAKKYRVDKLPTVILLDGDTVHMECTGAIDIDKVAKWLKGGDPTSPSGGE